MNQIEVEAAELPQLDGDVVRLSEGSYDIALFRVGLELRAIDNACPHQGASLCDGWVEDGVVACPWHAWQFDTRSGECLSVPDRDVAVYAVEMQGDKAVIQLKPLPTGEDEGEATQMDADV